MAVSPHAWAANAAAEIRRHRNALPLLVRGYVCAYPRNHAADLMSLYQRRFRRNIFCAVLQHADIRTADRRCFHCNQYLILLYLRNRNFFRPNILDPVSSCRQHPNPLFCSEIILYEFYIKLIM